MRAGGKTCGRLNRRTVESGGVPGPATSPVVSPRAVENLRRPCRAVPRPDRPRRPARTDPGRRGLGLRGEKDKRRDPDDPDDREQGSYWDHVIIDPETKLIVSLAVGRRDADTVVRLFTDFYQRTGGYLPGLVCTDEYAAYEAVILDAYGVCKGELELTPRQQAGFSLGDFHFPQEVTYATVHKQKENGRVVEVSGWCWAARSGWSGPLKSRSSQGR